MVALIGLDGDGTLIEVEEKDGGRLRPYNPNVDTHLPRIRTSVLDQLVKVMDNPNMNGAMFTISTTNSVETKRRILQSIENEIKRLSKESKEGKEKAHGYQRLLDNIRKTEKTMREAGLDVDRLTCGMQSTHEQKKGGKKVPEEKVASDEGVFTLSKKDKLLVIADGLRGVDEIALFDDSRTNVDIMNDPQAQGCWAVKVPDPKQVHITQAAVAEAEISKLEANVVLEQSKKGGKITPKAKHDSEMSFHKYRRAFNRMHRVKALHNKPSDHVSNFTTFDNLLINTRLRSDDRDALQVLLKNFKDDEQVGQILASHAGYDNASALLQTLQGFKDPKQSVADLKKQSNPLM